jgi:hypothetical protein
MNKPPERPSNPSMHLTIDGRKSDNVDMELCNKRRYAFYSDDEKTRFFHLYLNKSLSAFVTVKQLGIHTRATQSWLKCYYEDPQSVFEK